MVSNVHPAGQIIFDFLSWVYNVHPDYLIPAGERISDLFAVKLNMRRQGEVLRDRQFLALCTIQIQIQMQIQIQLRMQRHRQIGTSVEMKTQTQLQILACLLNNLMASIHCLFFCCQKKLDFASAFMTGGCWPDSSSGVA